MTKLEKDIETKLRQMVEKHGGKCLKWVCPGWTGVPDRIILLPGGMAMFVETKRPKGGKIDPLQRVWQNWLTSLGFQHYFVYDDAMIDTLELVILDELGRSK